jgi:hypothetical protein
MFGDSDIDCVDSIVCVCITCAQDTEINSI